MDRSETPPTQVATVLTFAPGSKQQNTANGSRIALWLAPIVEHRRRIQEAINRLSQEHSDLPVFRAHATLCSGTVPDLGEGLKKLLEMIDHFCAVRKKAAIKVDWRAGISHRDEDGAGWSTFLFLTLEPHSLFTEAETVFSNFGLRAKRDPEDASKALLLPHVSLAYCNPKSANFIDRAKISKELAAGLRSLEYVIFEAVELVMPESGDWSRIISATPDRWNVVYVQQLGPPNPTATGV